MGENTAAEAVNDMQRMNVAGNAVGKWATRRRTSDPHRGPRKACHKAPRGGWRGRGRGVDRDVTSD